MFNFLKSNKPVRRPADQAKDTPLHFKSVEAAFEIACKYMDCHLTKGSSLPAVVLEASEKAIKIVPLGHPFVMIRVASSDGGFLVPAVAATANGPSLEPGQMVLWTANSYDAEVAKGGNDERFGWVGVINATLKPQYVTGEGWVIDERYLP